MGETTQPEADPVAEPPADGPQSVRVTVEAPVPVRSRPLFNVVVILVVLAMLVVATDRSSAAPERSLQTRDETAYVEPISPTTIDADVAPTLVSDGNVLGTDTTAVTVPVGTEVVAGSHDATTVPDPVVDTTPATGTAPAAETQGTDSGSGGNGNDVSRAIPDPAPASAAAGVVSPWADKTRMTGAGYVATDVGCAAGTSAGALDAFFRDRVGPMIGDDYQHVYPLGGGRYLWLFQDAFLDYSGTAANLSQAVFNHNTAMVQDGACFTLYHRGTISVPTSFEPGNGENWKSKWFWPMGGQTVGGKLYVYWAQMLKDGYDPTGANGLGWHPVQTWLAVYDAGSLQRLSFQPAANSGVAPIYGYAVASDGEYTYLFGNSFEQNLQREGGFGNGPHSGTSMYLARIPLGQFGAALEYRSGDGWTGDASQATAISQRYWAENPMQPRYINGQWVAATKIDGYWGESLAIDVANDPWGPWTTVEHRGISPRGGDPLMNTYHAYLMPWTSGGSLVVSISQNARNMLRDAWPKPTRYRPSFFSSGLVAPPPREDTTTTIVAETTTTVIAETTTVVETTTTVVDTTTSDVATTTSTTPPVDTTTTTTEPSPTTTSTVEAPPPPPPPPPATTTTLPPECTVDTAESTTTTTTTTIPGGPVSPCPDPG